jgi:hypothetical protein
MFPRVSPCFLSVLIVHFLDYLNVIFQALPPPPPPTVATWMYYFELTWTTAADLEPQILCIVAYPTVVPSKSTPLSKQMQTLTY